MEPADAYRAVIVGYALVGVVLAVVFWRVSPAVEVPPAEVVDPTIRTRLGLHRSQGVVMRLSALFALDAFAGGFVMQSFIAFWFSERFGVDPGVLGVILFAANILAAVSALAAGPLAARFGLVRTMVFTHLPSNVLLILVPLMPTLPLAVARCSWSGSASPRWTCPRASPTRWRSWPPTSAPRPPGVTGIARSLGVAASPLIAAPLLVGSAYIGAPFVIAGSLKIVYDVLLYRRFQAVRPPEERPPDLGGGTARAVRPARQVHPGAMIDTVSSDPAEDAQEGNDAWPTS